MGPTDFGCGIVSTSAHALYTWSRYVLGNRTIWFAAGLSNYTEIRNENGKQWRKSVIVNIDIDRLVITDDQTYIIPLGPSCEHLRRTDL